MKLFSRLLNWAGALTCLLIILVACLTLVAIAFITYNVGLVEENKRIFLVNYRDPDWDEFGIEFTMNYILNSEEYNDVIFHGDSSCRFGVNVKLFEERTGRKAFNLGSTAWTGWSGYTLLLERYLEHHPKPKIVVFCVYPLMLPEAMPNGYIYEDRLMWSYGSGAEETRPKHPNGFRDYITEGTRSIAGYFTPGKRTYHPTTQLDNGLSGDALLHKWDQDRGSLSLLGHATPVTPPEQIEHFTISDRAKQNIFLMAQITKKKDILFALRLMPVWRDADVVQGDRNAIDKELNRYEKESSNLIVMSPTILEYDKSLFFEKWHLNLDGATKFTWALTPQIEELLINK